MDKFELTQVKEQKGSAFLTLTKMVGAIDDKGLLNGWIKFAGDGGGVLDLGIEKSYIWLFRNIPVLGDINFDPK